MAINRAALEKIIGPIAEDQFDVKVSLFVISSKSPRLKRIDLDNLTPEQRAEKLRKWGEQNRFVAVIEIGDKIFAHTHALNAEKLKNVKDLSLDGKKITVLALTNEQSKQLSDIGEAFEGLALKGESTAATSKIKQKADKGPRQFYAPSNLISDQVHITHVLITQMVKCDLGKIIINSLEQFSKARREEQKKQEADDLKHEIATSEIRSDRRKKEILKSAIEKKTINIDEVSNQLVVDDIKRTRRTRGAGS